MTPNNDVVLRDLSCMMTSNGSGDPSYLIPWSKTCTYLSTTRRTALLSSCSCTHSTYVVRTSDMHAPAIVAATIVTIICLTTIINQILPFDSAWAVSFLIEETCLGQSDTLEYWVSMRIIMDFNILRFWIFRITVFTHNFPKLKFRTQLTNLALD